MILEHAILPVRDGEQSRFEAAFQQARPLISCQPGFRGLTLSRSHESPTQYLLLVEWDTIEAHTEGFRTSAEYQDWKRLLHHFYDPFPSVEHFVDVDVLPTVLRASAAASSSAARSSPCSENRSRAAGTHPGTPG